LLFKKHEANKTTVKQVSKAATQRAFKSDRLKLSHLVTDIGH